MVRNGLCVSLGAALWLGAALSFGTAGEDAEARLRAQLALQNALQQGRDNLQRGNYQAAVYCLESQIARIDGNREYLTALREAYRGYVRELRQTNRLAEAEPYIERLKILDPGYQLELQAAPVRAAPTVAELASQGPVAARPKSSGMTVRPQMPDDPFADSNHARPSQTNDLLDRAEQEFSQRHYENAGRLFEKAHQLDSKATEGARDRWAYCKLFGVAEALNRSAGISAPDLEREVRHALELTTAPKQEAFGKDLLRKIQERRGGAGLAAEEQVEVRHTPAQGDGWAVAQTKNFRILHRQSRELAEKAARIAETTRAQMAQKWFGDNPSAWAPPCDIYLHASANDYAAATGAPAGSPGHSTMQKEARGERILSRQIDLHCDQEHMLDSILPHETTHVVLSGRFGRHVVPRWVDEGIAVLTEPRGRINLHLRNLPTHRRDHQLFAVGQLMGMDDYPRRELIGAFYAQSVSLVEFLSTQAGGPAVFTKFVRDGLDNGYEAALQRHYGMAGFAELEQRWQAYAFGTATTSAKLDER
jgi:tetratricopeptide (TPR) repeat protein